jgi:hypothetical protein
LPSVFAWEMNWTESPVCMVTKSWIYWLWFPALDCDRHVKRSDVTCWMYFTHIVFGLYNCLKSFQIATSFQPCRALSLAYFLDFFCASYKKNHATYMVQTNYLWVNDKWNYNIWNRKIILISMLPSCSVILPNPLRNIIICLIPLKFSLAVKKL